MVNKSGNSSRVEERWEENKERKMEGRRIMQGEIDESVQGGE